MPCKAMALKQIHIHLPTKLVKQKIKSLLDRPVLLPYKCLFCIHTYEKFKKSTSKCIMDIEVQPEFVSSVFKLMALLV